MKRLLVIFAAAALALAPFGVFANNAGEPGSDPADAAAATVMIDAEGAYGTGVVFKNKEYSFVWTDAHVVSDRQVVKKVIDPANGLPKIVVSYLDVWAVTEDIEDGRKVAQTKTLAKIIRYDDAQDIALLMVYKKNYGTKSVKFEPGVPKQGDAVWHVGSFYGPVGHGSMSEGTVASVGRLRREFQSTDTDAPYPYDQISCVAHKGSSGGGIFSKKTGNCLGLVTEFVGWSQNNGFTHGAFCITPSRRLIEWAKVNKVEFAVDDTVKVPSLAEIMAGPVTVNPLPAPDEKSPPSGGGVFPFWPKR